MKEELATKSLIKELHIFEDGMILFSGEAGNETRYGVMKAEEKPTMEGSFFAQEPKLHCSYCGKEFPPNFRFCPSCGAPLNLLVERRCLSSLGLSIMGFSLDEDGEYLSREYLIIYPGEDKWRKLLAQELGLKGDK